MKKIIIYDFDGTLTPTPITNFKILEMCGFPGGGNNLEFQKRATKRIQEKNTNIYEGFQKTILEVIKENNYELKDEIISIGAEEIKYNQDVYTFLENTHKNVDNYILSSSIQVFLEKTIISKFFKKIYATTYKYNKNKHITDIDYLMTDDNKVEKIKEIVKDNNYEKVIYIGDGLTDLKAMKYIKENGGISIYVTEDIIPIEYNDSVSYYFKKDYSKDSELTKFIYSQIKNTQK